MTAKAYRELGLRRDEQGIPWVWYPPKAGALAALIPTSFDSTVECWEMKVASHPARNGNTPGRGVPFNAIENRYTMRLFYMNWDCPANIARQFMSRATSASKKLITN
jgi:hypothetical protein